MSAGALAGRHALITGGGTGIGAAIAARLAFVGAGLTLLGRRREPLEACAERIGGASIVCADVTRESDVERAFEEARARSGPVHVLVNNAGAVESAPIARTDLGLWHRMLEVNLTGAFLCARAFLAGAGELDYGRVINVASTAGVKGYPYVAAYCAAKHGVVGLTRALALETARTPVTVNAVCPGYTDTELVARAVDNIAAKTGRSPEAARQDLQVSNPQGRLVRPEEVAETVAWLCASGSGAVTGQAVVVAGGEVTP